jgi:uncharacterized membrane protein YozB (DUF420 family)
MNPYLEPDGFLGTGASLLADLTLVAYILLIVPGMIAGYTFARRGLHRPYHKYTMMTIVVVNWFLIIFLMLTAYSYDVIGNIGAKPTNPRYLMPTIHGILGLVAQVLATYIVYRMVREDTLVARGKQRGETKEQLSKYWFLNAKKFMRLTLVLWLATALLGVFNYLIRYDILPRFSNAPAAPVATEEPAATHEPAATLEAASTPEVSTDDDGDDNSGPGSDNSGRGSDDDDSPASTPEA